MYEVEDQKVQQILLGNHIRMAINGMAGCRMNWSERYKYKEMVLGIPA